MTAHCDCPQAGPSDPKAARCPDTHRTDDGSRWVCTRPRGHDGPHSACVPGGEHPVSVWSGDGFAKGGDL